MRRNGAVRASPPAKQSRLPEKQSATHKEPPPPPGPHLLIVSIKSQRLSLYANGKFVMHSPVSTGTPTHPTPHGVFSIIQKNRHHRSNIYSDAPMPYMQRLTWSGVALHQGVLPGRPASHGCIRLPEQFASFLWRTTKLGARVVVSSEDIEPYEVAHAKLFQPKPAPTTVETAPPLRRTFDTTTPAYTRTAAMTMVLTDAPAEQPDDKETDSADANPNAAGQQNAEPIASVADEMPKPDLADANPTSALPLSMTETDEGTTVTASIYPQEADIPEAILASFVQTLEAKQNKAPPRGPISVFISRKEKRLYVRQGFIPLFTAKVDFRDDKAVSGTHVLTAFDKDGDGKELRWLAVTLPAENPNAEPVKIMSQVDARGRRIEVAVKPQVKPATLPPVPSIASVLDRINIAPEVVERVSEYVGAGASLIVSDLGLGYETGLYTDFIVVTRKAKSETN